MPPASPSQAVLHVSGAPFDGAVAVAGAEFAADPAGVIYWPEQGLL
ncbi:MAG: hypothetical protein QOF91_2671, partial [Alphaproteobacteria bacterium]|nr:hypothetical protein [Alphaproteobacteria bacterium]